MVVFFYHIFKQGLLYEIKTVVSSDACVVHYAKYCMVRFNGRYTSYTWSYGLLDYIDWLIYLFVDVIRYHETHGEYF